MLALLLWLLALLSYPRREANLSALLNRSDLSNINGIVSAMPFLYSHISCYGLEKEIMEMCKMS